VCSTIRLSVLTVILRVLAKQDSIHEAFHSRFLTLLC